LLEAAKRRDSEVHGRLFEAAYLAGFALNACGMGFHHATCHVLGGLTRVPHGIINAIVLPHAVRANAEVAPQAVAGVAQAFGIPDLALRAEAIGVACELPKTLGERGVRGDIVERAVASILASPLMNNNPAPVPAALVERVVRAAIGA
jgi:alcohol dehydrogenase class IV